MNVLTLQTPDVNDEVPDISWFGRRMRHSGNGKTYIVVGFAWMGETDQWGFLHREYDTAGAVMLCRPLAHMDGARPSNGERRYEVLV